MGIRFEVVRQWRRWLEWTVSPAGVRRLLGWSVPGESRSPEPLDLSRVERLGVVRLDGMGDLVVTTPFLRELRRSAPRARITLVVRSEWLPLMRACPHVDEVLGFELTWRPDYRLQRNLWNAWGWARRELRPRRWDAVLVPQAHFGVFDARWLAWFSGARFRLGRREGVGAHADPGWSFLSEVRETPAFGHDVINTLSWLEALGGEVRDQSLWIEPGDAARAEAARHLSVIPSGRVPVALGIGASQVEKVWPLDRFEEIGRRLQALGATLVLVGGSDFSEPARRLVERLGGGVLDLTARLPLDVTAAVLGRCGLYVGNDTGPMHMAAAMGLSVVEIVGWPADVPEQVVGTPKRIGPWCSARRIVQPATAMGVSSVQIERVSVDEVWDAICSLVAESPVPGLDLRGVMQQGTL